VSRRYIHVICCLFISYRKCLHIWQLVRLMIFVVFTEDSHLSLAQIVQVIYYRSYKYLQHIVGHETGISVPTIVDFYNFCCREVCCVERLGSAGHYAYDVIEVHVPRKKNSRFRLWASDKATPVPMLTYISVSFLFSFIFMVRVRVKNRVGVRVSF